MFIWRIFIKYIVQPVHDLLHLALETSNSLIFDFLGLLVHPPFPLQTVRWLANLQQSRNNFNGATTWINHIYLIAKNQQQQNKQQQQTSSATNWQNLFYPQGNNNNNTNEKTKQHLFDPTHLQVVSALHGFHVLLAPPLRSSHFHLRACVNNQ